MGDFGGDGRLGGKGIRRGPTESKTVPINVAQEETARPKQPPPQAPWKFRTYPEDQTRGPMKLADPSSGSGNHLRDADRKGKYPKGKGDCEG